MAYYGNLALRPERIHEERVQQPKQTQTHTQRSKVTRPRSIPIGEKLLYIFTIAVVVFVAGFIIYRYAQIYQINGEIQTKNKVYEQTTDQLNELQKEVEQLSNPDRIVKTATEYGMVPVSPAIKITPKDDQTAVAMTQPKG
jgi:cell division protein FtsL